MVSAGRAMGYSTGVTSVLGALAVVAAVVALVARRLEHMAVLMGLVGGLLSVDLLARGDTFTAVGLIAAAGIMAAVVLVAVAVIEVDARPSRRLQPWKVLLLAPLAAVGWWASSSGAVAIEASPRAAPGAVLVLGLVALGVPLLVRRTSSAPVGGRR